MAARYAVVLRGPTGVGKSTARNIIAERWSALGRTTKLVTLDNGWGARANGPVVEFRTFGTTPRETYRDLIASEDLLLIELGWGEPGDAPGRQGATLAPRKWLDLLRQEGRTVLLYRFAVTEQEWAARLRAREHRGPAPGECQHWARIELDSDGINFPARAALRERLISTVGKSSQDVAYEILSDMQAAVSALAAP